MTIRTLLVRHGRTRARGRARWLAGRVVLIGATLVAALLFLKRAGFDVPFLWLPDLSDERGFADRVVGFAVVSLAGLVQGVVLLAGLLLAAGAVRVLGGLLLRPRPARTARDLDRALSTDRYSSALEASGPFAPMVEREALRQSPPVDALVPRGRRRLERWLRRAALALVLLVAVAPGTAPGEEGDAPVLAPPDEGREEAGLRLTLDGAKKRFGPREPIPVQVIAEAPAAPATDLDLEIRLKIDDGAEIVTGRHLFLAAGAPGQDSLTLDLRRHVRDLAPGEHRAVARAGGVESNVYLFRIDAEGGQGGRDPPPPQPNEAQAPQAAPGGGGQQKWKPEFVEPLVANQDKVKKKARVPIEVPGGGAPREQPLEEAWPELERRKEAALNRPELSPAARSLVREYFERLKPEREK